MKQKTILLVEDEASIASIEKAYLEKAGFTVDLAQDGAEAQERYQGTAYSLIILDLMLPKISGEELLSDIRKNSEVPVIVVSAKSAEDDRVLNLRNGADDYLVKPFSARELVERVRAILRRAPEEGTTPLSTSDGRIRLEPDSMRVFKDQEEVHLTKNEYSILYTLFSHPNKIFTRDEIIDIAFGMDYEAFDRAIDTHIKNIRQKLEDDPRSPMYINTVYGVGYRAGGMNEAAK